MDAYIARRAVGHLQRVLAFWNDGDNWTKDVQMDRHGNTCAIGGFFEAGGIRPRMGQDCLCGAMDILIIPGMEEAVLALEEVLWEMGLIARPTGNHWDALECIRRVNSNTDYETMKEALLRAIGKVGQYTELPTVTETWGMRMLKEQCKFVTDKISSWAKKKRAVDEGVGEEFVITVRSTKE